ncbi:hypothetical protein [Citrobacter portucalensis]|uniref:hypothetical protein n=1 Tax=Citrobacter portucalensis TaxID=1639133 RepID=UPI001F156E96|nr:hypothetical protein [Citrobacter portucalensis]
MNKNNEVISMPGEDALYILSEVEYMLISLRNIARYYFNGVDQNIVDDKLLHSYFKETTRFIDDRNITCRLAEIRKIITEKFNADLGEDDMDDIEREMEKINYWEKPGD